jgi:xylulokinase
MLLTVDIGTSSFKSALWDFSGKRLLFFSVPISINADNGSMQNAAKYPAYEADPSVWLRAFEECCENLLKNCGNFNKVEAIVISGNGPSLVPVLGKPVIDNKLNVPAENARLWLDRRASEYQDAVSEAAGGFVDASFFLPKIMHIKNEEKEIYNRTITFLGCPEYLAYALTGQNKTVFPCEGFDRWFWNESVLQKLDLDASRFPDFIRPGEQFGELSASAAKLFGFKENIPVVSGGPDFFSAIIGSGVKKPGQALDRTGSSEGINLCTYKLISIDNFLSYKHPIKPYWNLSAIISKSGMLIENELKKLGVNNFDEFISLAVRNREEKEKSARQVLEKLCFQIKEIIIKMENEEAIIDELRVTGGLSHCDLLNRIKADITGKKIITLNYKEAELLGCAVIGCCYLGKFTSYSEASSAMIKTNKQYEPDLKNTDFYNELFNNKKRCS